MRKFAVVFGILLCVFDSYADVAYQQKTPVQSENGILTSQEYVNDRVERNQDKIQPLPAGTTVDKIMTDPATSGGTPGARDIVTDISTGASDGIPTSDAVYNAKETRNNKIEAFNDQNIVTYSGTNGTPTTGTPIYSKERNTYENGLIRASTLNEAVQFARDHELTRINTPQGTLWNVTGSTAGNALPTTIYAPPLERGISRCYKPILPTNDFPAQRGACTETRWGPDVDTPNEYSHRGDWGVVFNYETRIAADGAVCSGANSSNCRREIRGISACISTGGIGGRYPAAPSSLWPILDAAYNAHKNGEPLASDATKCYCKLTNPSVSGTSGTASRWILTASGDNCASTCALTCADRANSYHTFHMTMFGAYTE